MLATIEREVNSPEFKRIVEELSKYEDKIAEALNFDNIATHIQNLSESEFYSTCVRTKVTPVLEQLAIPGQASSVPSMDSQMDTALNPAAPTEGGGILGMAKRLLSSLTEGGSVIGILHLILDIVGIIGDAVFVATGFPLGTVADFLNAMIYFYRGPDKYLLGIISLLAAFVPFGGDVLKGFKGVLGPFTKAFSKVTTKGAGKQISKETAETLIKVSPQNFKQSSRAMDYMSKSSGKIGSSMMGAVGAISKNVIGKLVGYIPFIGKHLKAFFTKLGSKSKTIATNLDTFSKTYSNAAQATMKAETKGIYKHMNKVMKEGTGTIVEKKGAIIVTDAAGTVKKMPLSKFAEISQVAKKFPDGELGKYLSKSNSNVVTFYNTLAKEGHTAGVALSKMGKVGKIHTGKIKYFIAKSLVRLFSGGQNMEGFETDAMANMLTKDEIDNRKLAMIDADRKERGALQTGHYADLQTDKGREFSRLMYCDLVANAKMTGLPPIASNDNMYGKVYGKSKGSDSCYGDNSFRAYNYQVAKQEQEDQLADEFFAQSLSQEDLAKLNDMPTFESVSFKHIKPFTKF